METRKVYNQFSEEAIRKITELRFQMEKLMINSGCIEAIDESDNNPFLWKYLQRHELAVLSPAPVIQDALVEPYLVLAGLLEELYKSSLPEELQMQGLTIQIQDNKAYFCISGSISLDDLHTLCEHHTK